MIKTGKNTKQAKNKGSKRQMTGKQNVTPEKKEHYRWIDMRMYLEVYSK